MSVNYRLTNEAIFSAQIHDVKAAIRWIKKHADIYHIDPNKIGIWGHSAGGHLAALAGTSHNDRDLEGVQRTADYSSEVQAVIASAAPVDLLKMGGWHDHHDSSEARLLGGPIQERKEEAIKANPLT